VEGDDDAEDEEAAAQKQQPAARRAGVADGGRAAECGERRAGTVLRGGRAAAGVAHAVAAGVMALGSGGWWVRACGLRGGAGQRRAWRGAQRAERGLEGTRFQIRRTMA